MLELRELNNEVLNFFSCKSVILNKQTKKNGDSFKVLGSSIPIASNFGIVEKMLFAFWSFSILNFVRSYELKNSFVEYEMEFWLDKESEL